MSIAANLQAQLTSQFIAALGNGTSIETQKAAVSIATALAELKSGQTITAVVTGDVQNGKLPILLNGAPLLADIKGAALPADALKSGAQFLLKVETAGTTPKLTFQSLATATPDAAALIKANSLLTNSIASPAILISTAQVPDARVITQLALAPLPATTATPLQQAILQAAGEAATRQGSAAPLYADLAAILAKPDNGLPQGVARIATALLNGRLDGEKPVSPDDLKQTINASGIFLETRALRPDVHPPDAKALLIALQAALQSNETLPSKRLTADQEPPRRDAPVLAHKSVPSLLKDEIDTQKIVSTLTRESEQAVERIKLHQIASLPERLVMPEQPQTRQFNFEIPIAFGQQTAMAGFRIEQEKKRDPKPGEPTDIWGIRFAIDADVLGPVQAHVRLSGPTISVSLWAEDPATHRFFVQSMPLLEAALAENALEIGELIAFPGKPAQARPSSAGHFMDKRS